MGTIREEIKKIYPFLLVLILLYAINLGFNMYYDWGGVSVIVRVYIMVLSCYVVFNFSQLDTDELRELYKDKYGKWGDIYLFFILRIFPFLFIYLMTVIFTLINYIQNVNWPVDPLLKLMDGRYSNTVIYTLILFVVLRLKLRPGIAIPAFIVTAMCYFYMDKLLYKLFEPGIGISIVKLMKFAAFYFILVYGYSRSRLKFLHSTAAGAVAGTISFAALFSVYFMIFVFSDPGKNIHSISAKTLLKCGFYQVFESFESSVAKYNTVSDVKDLIIYSGKSGKDIQFSREQWESFAVTAKTDDADYIFRYLYKKNIRLNFENVMKYAEFQSVKNPDYILGSKNFKKYFSSFYAEKNKDFFSTYDNGSMVIKMLIIDALSYVDDYQAVRFLTERLTDVDKKISERAYHSLMRITKLDPADSGKKEFYDLDVVNAFRKYAESIR